MIHRYRGHQYHYSGHCVSFMQNTIKTVDTLPNLPIELDIVLLRPSESILNTHQRYRPQFQTAFRLRKSHIIAWLEFLRLNHPDYRYVNISPARIDALPIDNDMTSIFPAIIINAASDIGPTEPPIDPNPRPPPLPNPWSRILILILQRRL
jgi:hypothetical protein